jgi:dimeric dUTPase (all-alpha-NTP-PPase superfamily)
MSLETMLETQRELQAAFDKRAVSDDPQQSCEYLKDMAFATEDELHELMGEVGWKPWGSSWHINTALARGEWIDAWHFMMNIAIKLGMTSEMIEEMYNAKAEINRGRIAKGYSGLEKCPGCNRALDDPEVRCKVNVNSGVVTCMGL